MPNWKTTTFWDDGSVFSNGAPKTLCFFVFPANGVLGERLCTYSETQRRAAADGSPTGDVCPVERVPQRACGCVAGFGKDGVPEFFCSGTAAMPVVGSAFDKSTVPRYACEPGTEGHFTESGGVIAKGLQQDSAHSVAFVAAKGHGGAAAHRRVEHPCLRISLGNENNPCPQPGARIPNCTPSDKLDNLPDRAPARRLRELCLRPSPSKGIR
jgi:hypothetical protein